jgi:MoaA/NifB/PqqE/SkfB family radical SAM enzyme
MAPISAPINGTQLYGLKKLWASLKIGGHIELKDLSLKQKLALNYVSKESKLTKVEGKIFSNTFTPYFPSLAYDRFLKGLISITSGKPMPVITNLAVTAKCPCDCWHCLFSDRSKKDEWTLEKLKKTIAEVQDLGTSVIGITGGEPLLRKDLEEIIASIDQRSMPIMFTTGYKLTIDRVRALKKAGLEIPVISLDHYRPEEHDKGRGKKGMFEYAVKAIEMFKSEGFYTAVSFVPDRKLVDDRDEIFKIIDFFRDLGVNDMRLTSPILSGQLTARPEEKLTKENIKTIFEIQKKCTKTKGYPGIFAYDFFESKYYYGCCAGYNYMFIDSQGNVCPCDFTAISLGNVKKKPVKDIWQETSSCFRKPGCICYANKISDAVAAKKAETFPLDKEASKQVIKECPPYDVDETPVFFKKMGSRF